MVNKLCKSFFVCKSFGQFCEKIITLAVGPNFGEQHTIGCENMRIFLKLLQYINYSYICTLVL